MNKYILCILLWAFMPKMGLAIDLELSDIIKEARESEMQIRKSQIQQNVEQTKKDLKQQIYGEQNATETISKEEILKLQQQNQDLKQ